MSENLMTLRQVAATGIMSEYGLRKLAEQQRLPCVYIGNRCYVNFRQLQEQLNNLPGNIAKED